MMFNNYKKSKKQLPKYREGDIVRPVDAEGTAGTTANYFNTKRNNINNIGQYTGYAQAALNLGTQLNANKQLSGDQKNTANAGAINNTVDSVLGQATPWYGLANTASNLVGSVVKRDSEGRPIDAGNQFIDTTAKPMHKSLIEDISKGDYGSAVGDLFGARNIASIGALFAPKNERLRGMASGEESLFAMGGKYQYAQGGINSEVERQENTLNPDGSTNQYNGNSHESGGIQTHLDPGTLVFSDRLKHQGKTFAALNKPNNTSKEDKIINDPKASNHAKNTAQLMKDVKNKNSLSLFDIQESLKADKHKSQLEKDFFACGGMVKYKDGGIHIKPENRGKFTTAAQRAGMSVQEYANHILSHKENYSSTLVKRAQFAENSTKFKHENGGIQQFAFGGEQPGNPSTTPFLQAFNQNKGSSNYGMMYGADAVKTATRQNLLKQHPGLEYVSGARNTGNELYRIKDDNGIWNYQYFGLNPDTKQGMFIQGQDPNKPLKEVNLTLPEQPIVNPTYHPIYKQEISGIPKSKQQGIVEQYASGGKKNNREDNYRPVTDKRVFENTLEGPNTSNVSNYNNVSESPYGSYRESAPNWFNRNKDSLYQLGFGLAQNAGQLAYLGEQGKKYDTQPFYQYTPSTLDPSAALRDSEMQNRIVNSQLRDSSGGNAGTLMSNLQAAHVNRVLNNDRIRQQYANQNAQISNQGQQYNIGNRYMTDDINARNKGQALTNYYGTLGSLGTNVAQGMKDNRQMGMDEKTIGMFAELYNNPEFRKFMENYKKK